MEYRGLTEAEKLAIARDRLRDMEADHFRLTITDDKKDADRVSRLETKITNTQAAIDAILPLAEAEAAARADRAAAEADPQNIAVSRDPRTDL